MDAIIFTHVPLDVVGEHAQEDVGAYPCLEAVANPDAP